LLAAQDLKLGYWSIWLLHVIRQQQYSGMILQPRQL
jgi:hypothetical protein